VQGPVRPPEDDEDDDDYDDRPARGRGRDRDDEEKPFPVVPVALGAVAAMVLLTGVVTAVIVSRKADKPDEVAAATNPPAQPAAATPTNPAPANPVPVTAPTATNPPGAGQVPPRTIPKTFPPPRATPPRPTPQPAFTPAIPAQGTQKDDLAALNRDPARFAGRTLEMKVSAVPVTPRIRDSNDFSVIFPNHRAPRNLTFTISSSMKARMIEGLGKDLRLNMIVPVRVTAAVPPQPPAGAKVTVPVTKIDFLDEDGKVIKTIE
jgi:hypothetical protein